jgi:hypothetical protein
MPESFTSTGSRPLAPPRSWRPIVERYSSLFFVLLLACVVFAFWPSYFSQPFHRVDPFVAAHATAQTAWLLLVIGQAIAISGRQPELHRAVGNRWKWLVALVVITTIILMHRRLQGLPLDDVRLQIVGFNFTTVLIFGLIYGQAMRQRLNRDVHVALIFASVLPMFTAFGSRLIEESSALVALSVRTFGGVAALNQAALVPADLMMIALSLWDWRSHRRLTIFPPVLLLLAGLHLSPMVFGHAPLWRQAVEWFVRLP